MTLTSREKELVGMSFMKIAPTSQKTAERFYTRLFEVAPETKTLFNNTEMHEQAQKFMRTISTVIASLNRTETLDQDMEELTKRHIDYGVMKEHYPIVGEALLWAFKEELGDDYTNEIHLAWQKMYELLTESVLRHHE